MFTGDAAWENRGLLRMALGALDLLFLAAFLAVYIKKSRPTAFNTEYLQKLSA
jgi:hypothetical protein